MKSLLMAAVAVVIGAFAVPADAALLVTVTGKATGSIAGVAFANEAFGFVGTIGHPGSGTFAPSGATGESYVAPFGSATMLLDGLSIHLTTPLSLIETRSIDSGASGFAQLSVTDTPDPLNGYHPVFSADLLRPGFELAAAFAGAQQGTFTTFANLDTQLGSLVLTSASTQFAFTFVNPIPPSAVLILTALGGLGVLRVGTQGGRRTAPYGTTNPA